MDLKGSLVDSKVKVIPSEKLVEFIKTIPLDAEAPHNIWKVMTGNKLNNIPDSGKEDNALTSIHLNDDDIIILNQVSDIMQSNNKNFEEKPIKPPTAKISDKNKETSTMENFNEENFLQINDLVWLYTYLHKERYYGNKAAPYLHVLLEGSEIKLPENKLIKRNPDLEARCVKLRAQQESREYRKMTKTVDNVRMRYPEDTIAYQMKHINRQLIAVGQFIISIFAGFLFGFRGIEWIVGNLDFGFRLLLGVMCALVIALAEIYFLAKKLNEEYSMPETVQLGGPPKLAHEVQIKAPKKTTIDKTKEHED